MVGKFSCGRVAVTAIALSCSLKTKVISTPSISHSLTLPIKLLCDGEVVPKGGSKLVCVKVSWALRFLSIVFDLERTNQLSLLPDKDLVDLCSPIEPYQVTKSRKLLLIE